MLDPINTLTSTIVQSYMDAGFKLCSIPPNSKGPIHNGWNLPTGALTTPHLPPGWGVGLMHQLSGTCAIDVDDFAKTATYMLQRGINLQQLFDADDSVQIVSGRPNRGKLLFRLSTPLASKKIVIDGVTAFELRCATADGKSVQDVLAGSIHPDTHQSYVWGGKGHFTRLPQLPDSLMALWHELLIVREHTPSDVVASDDEIASALASIDPSCPHDEWLQVGMALHSAGQSCDVWDSWSQSSDKYRPGECVTRWQSFKGHGITIASLFKLAYDSGWRKPVDLSMFKAVSTAPDKVLKRLESTIDAPVIDLSLWPSVLADYAQEIALEVGCDPAVPLMAGLAAVCGAADKRTKLKITESWGVPPVLWLMTIGAPSDKKSPGSRPMFKTLKALENEHIDAHLSEMLIWKGKEAKNASQLKAYREWAVSPEAELANSVPPAYEECPPEPKALRLIISDSTSQKVVHMAVGRDRGFLLYLDEMNHWLNKLNDNRSGEDRGCYIQGYETGSYAMDRVGAGSLKVDNMALGVYGNCQPAVFKEHMGRGSTDGLLQRFIPIVLNSDLTVEWQDSVPEFMSSAGAYEGMIRQVFACGQQEVTLSAGALAEFRAFTKWYLEGRKLDLTLNASTVYQTAAGKLEGTCARLALLLHLIQSPHGHVLSVECMQQAVSIMRQFFVPSLRYSFMEIAGIKDPLDAWVLDHVIQLASARESVTLSEIRRSAKRQLVDREGWRADNAIISVMDQLEAYGYVKTDADKQRARVPSWFINPELATLYKTQRDAIIKAKQDVLVHFREEAIRRGKTINRFVNAIGSVQGALND